MQTTKGRRGSAELMSSAYYFREETRGLMKAAVVPVRFQRLWTHAVS